MNKKGILATLLVIKIVLMLITTFSLAIAEKEDFSISNQYQRIASYRLTSSFEDISSDMQYLKNLNATQDSLDEYMAFVDETFSDYFVIDLELNQTFLTITDSNLEMIKRGKV
ncbi:MAG TPA: hypothetical protein ENN30_02350 [Candidatus Woesearchaeota archaeon]|nr:hypothetical protein [Candidatus Woesearchaeota archaeon]